MNDSSYAPEASHLFYLTQVCAINLMNNKLQHCEISSNIAAVRRQNY